MVPYLGRAQSAYKDIRICSFYLTHTHPECLQRHNMLILSCMHTHMHAHAFAHTHMHTHIHTQNIF